MENIGEVINKKLLGIPAWMWLVIGGVVFWLFSRMSLSAGSQGYGLAAQPTTDQMSANAIRDVLGAINQSQSDMDDRFGDIIASQADANAQNQKSLSDFMDSQAAWFQAIIDQNNNNQAALVGVLHDQQDGFASQMAAQNSSFIGALNALSQSFHNTAPPSTSAPPTTGGTGIAQWVLDRLQSPYWQTRKYITKTDTNLGPQYSDAVNAYIRSDNPTGLNTSGQPSANAQSQLAQLIAQGLVAPNPYYPGN